MADEEIKDVKTQESVKPDISKAEAPVGSKDYNWRQMEQTNRQLAQELAEIKSKLATQTQPRVEEIDDLANLQDDDLLTTKQAVKLAKKLAKSVIDEENQKKEKELLPHKTKSKFTDFDQVVTEENIKQLTQEDPEIEKEIAGSLNPYAAVYRAIKSSQFYGRKKESAYSEKKIEENLAKPRSANSVGRSDELTKSPNYKFGDKSLYENAMKFYREDFSF